MLTTLRIHNLAIVSELEIEFGSGLNVLTGETGAGKSIILRAIDLISGKRASVDVIRSGSERCEVEAVFALSKKELAKLCAEQDELDSLIDGEEILIRRILDRSGKSKVYFNGRLITLGVLQHFMPILLDITGQHEQQGLLESNSHLALLDGFGVPEDLRLSVAEKYRAYAEAAKALESFLRDSQAQMDHIARIRDELTELQEIKLEVGERARLNAELSALTHVEVLTAAMGQALELVEGDEEAIEPSMRKLHGILERAAAIDPELKSILQLVESAFAELGEVRLSLAHYGSRLEADPEHIESLRSRIADIARLERKYRRTTEEILAYQEKITAELAAFEGGEFDEESLRQKESTLRGELNVLESSLTKERTKVGGSLAKKVDSELKHLNMAKAKFEVAINPKPSSLSGADQIEFLLAANPGEPLRPLVKVASGGELSRILLILKTLLHQQQEPGTQIFDEVDTGISGAVSQVVGEKLCAVAKKSQVIVVTHSPQIAALAENHFLVSKESSASETKTSVSRLAQEERVSHIAGMLAGKRISSHFMDSARELLRQPTQD